MDTNDSSCDTLYDLVCQQDDYYDGSMTDPMTSDYDLLDTTYDYTSTYDLTYTITEDPYYTSNSNNMA